MYTVILGVLECIAAAAGLYGQIRHAIKCIVSYAGDAVGNGNRQKVLRIRKSAATYGYAALGHDISH